MNVQYQHLQNVIAVCFLKYCFCYWRFSWLTMVHRRGFHRGKSLFPLGLFVLAFGKFSLLSWRGRLWVRFACESYPGIVEFCICIYFIIIYFLFIHELPHLLFVPRLILGATSFDRRVYCPQWYSTILGCCIVGLIFIAARGVDVCPV
jgi:hypothetical protein